MITPLPDLISRARAVGLGVVIALGVSTSPGLADQAAAVSIGGVPSSAALESLSAARRQVVALLPDWPAGAVNTQEPEGSAVRLSPDGLLLTADHVLGRATALARHALSSPPPAQARAETSSRVIGAQHSARHCALATRQAYSRMPPWRYGWTRWPLPLSFLSVERGADWGP